MSQEKELTASDYFLKLREEKGWFEKAVVPDLTNAQLGVMVEFAEKYAQELLKLKLGELLEKIEDHKGGMDHGMDGYSEAATWNTALMKVEKLIEKTLSDQ